MALATNHYLNSDQNAHFQELDELNWPPVFTVQTPLKTMKSVRQGGTLEASPNA
jgi:hypothetical protein